MDVLSCTVCTSVRLYKPISLWLYFQADQCMDAQSLELCARKTASMGGGDVRKALDVCKLGIARYLNNQNSKQIIAIISTVAFIFEITCLDCK